MAVLEGGGKRVACAGPHLARFVLPVTTLLFDADGTMGGCGSRR